MRLLSFSFENASICFGVHFIFIDASHHFTSHHHFVPFEISHFIASLDRCKGVNFVNISNWKISIHFKWGQFNWDAHIHKLFDHFIVQTIISHLPYNPIWNDDNDGDDDASIFQDCSCIIQHANSSFIIQSNMRIRFYIFLHEQKSIHLVRILKFIIQNLIGWVSFTRVVASIKCKKCKIDDWILNFIVLPSSELERMFNK